MARRDTVSVACDLATDLGVEQGTLQLFREVWRKPSGEAEQRRGLMRFSGARYKELRHVQSRASTLGSRVQGGTAVCRTVHMPSPLGSTAIIERYVGPQDRSPCICPAHVS